MKKLFALAALVCSATFAKAQYSTFRIIDNTGYLGVKCDIFGDRFPGRICATDNQTPPHIALSPGSWMTFTPGTVSWVYPGASVLNGVIIFKPDATGTEEPTTISVHMLCGIPASGISVMTNFIYSGDPVTLTFTPVGASQMDIVLTP
jgi:hypothetical protein